MILVLSFPIQFLTLKKSEYRNVIKTDQQQLILLKYRIILDGYRAVKDKI